LYTVYAAVADREKAEAAKKEDKKIW